jgi:hypothetical protein
MPPACSRPPGCTVMLARAVRMIRRPSPVRLSHGLLSALRMVGRPGFPAVARRLCLVGRMIGRPLSLSRNVNAFRSRRRTIAGSARPAVRSAQPGRLARPRVVRPRPRVQALIAAERGLPFVVQLLFRARMCGRRDAPSCSGERVLIAGMDARGIGGNPRELHASRRTARRRCSLAAEICRRSPGTDRGIRAGRCRAVRSRGGFRDGGRHIGMALRRERHIRMARARGRSASRLCGLARSGAGARCRCGGSRLGAIRCSRLGPARGS